MNLKESVEDDLQAYLDGYEELGDDDKAKIAAAVEAGHVADEDWKWVSSIGPDFSLALTEHLKGCRNEQTRPERISNASV